MTGHIAQKWLETGAGERQKKTKLSQTISGTLARAYVRTSTSRRTCDSWKEHAEGKKKKKNYNRGETRLINKRSTTPPFAFPRNQPSPPERLSPSHRHDRSTYIYTLREREARVCTTCIRELFTYFCVRLLIYTTNPNARRFESLAGFRRLK